MLAVTKTTILALHLICVGVASSGPLACIWLDWREGRGNLLAGRAGRMLCWQSVFLLAVGAALGVLSGWLAWDEAYREVLQKFWGKIYFGFWEFLFSLVLLLATAAWWQLRPRGRKSERGARTLLLLLASTNLLYHFPLLFVLVADVAQGHLSLAEDVTPALFRQLILGPAVIARAVHFFLASLVLTGLALTGLACWRDDTAEAAAVAAWGGRLALAAMLLQLPLGIWLVSELPPPQRGAVLGSNLPATALLGAAVVAALALMHPLSALAMGDTNRKSVLLAMALTTILIVLMAGVTQAI